MQPSSSSGDLNARQNPGVDPNPPLSVGWIIYAFVFIAMGIAAVLVVLTGH
ncbi:MAG: hypothetical protein V1778_00085 [bacterium]